MARPHFLIGASAIALMVATSAFAQSEITGSDALNDRLDDIDEAIADDLARSNDDNRFGNPEFQPGLSGSASLGYSGKTGNNESQEFSAGARLRYAQGPFVQTLGVALDFADDNGVKTKEDVFAVYDGNYYFNDQLYAFILGRVETDGLADAANENKVDGFIGVGPGYRIINTPDATWRVQAGVGVSYLKDGADNSDTETGYIASSRAYYRFSDAIFGTMDTDVLKSDSALRINNDLGVNFQVSDQFSTRISYLTEYNDSRAIRTDNKVGLSLVYGF
jgi:putative salt-induced outer membrane protein